jgi:hypothetical protein
LPARLHHFSIIAVAFAVSVTALGLGSESAVAVTPTVTGTIVAVKPGDFIIRTPGSTGGKLNAMVTYANKLQAKNYPYVYAGGHAKVGVASGAHAKGFDCSGVAAAVLAAGGLWPKGTSVPGDTGVIQQLRAKKAIASGPAAGPYQVALLDKPGQDIQMKINGRFYGTGVGSRGGAGWLDSPIGFGGYKEYHVLPGVLGERNSDGNDMTFTFGASASQAAIAAEVTVGAEVQVSYTEAGSSTIRAASVKNIGGKPFKSTTGVGRMVRDRR